MKKNNLDVLFDEFSSVEEKLCEYTRKHPVTMLAAAVGLGFSVGCFGLMKVFQASVAMNLQDKMSLKDFFASKDKSSGLTKTQHEGPHAQA